MNDSTESRREVLLALVSPVEGKDDEFRAWYWGEHLAEVLQVPGFVSAQRYRSTEPGDAPAPYRYATFYQVEGSAEEARNRLFGAGLSSSDTMDLSTMVIAPFVAEEG